VKANPIDDAEPLLLDLERFPTFSSCASTQDLCRALAEQGAPEGTTVSAWEQTAGRGRGEHRWHSPGGMGLLLSFVLRPRLEQAAWPALTALTSLALAEALEELPGHPSVQGGVQEGRSAAALPWIAGIKWPNDLYGTQGKLAGVLAETAGSGLVVGLGVNLLQGLDDFPPELQGRASSLRQEGFDPVPDAREAARHLNQSLTRHYRLIQEGRSDLLRSGLLERFYLRGADVRVESAGNPIEGMAVDIGPSGELILLTDQGRRSIFGGVVTSYRRPSQSAGPGSLNEPGWRV
jgi:BirA family transcriptional regulator, biotin operon repressor / biotin---[acetyl-CoA-carboxylase] ligase